MQQEPLRETIGRAIWDDGTPDLEASTRVSSLAQWPDLMESHREAYREDADRVIAALGARYGIQPNNLPATMEELLAVQEKTA